MSLYDLPTIALTTWERLAALYDVPLPAEIEAAVQRRSELSTLIKSNRALRGQRKDIAALLADADDLDAALVEAKRIALDAMLTAYIVEHTDPGSLGEAQLGRALRRSTADFRAALAPRVGKDLDVIVASAKRLTGDLILDPASTRMPDGRIDVDAVRAMNDILDPLDRVGEYAKAFAGGNAENVPAAVVTILTLVEPDERIEPVKNQIGTLGTPDVSSATGKAYRNAVLRLEKDLRKNGPSEVLARIGRGDYVALRLAVAADGQAAADRLHIVSRAFNSIRVSRPGMMEDKADGISVSMG